MLRVDKGHGCRSQHGSYLASLQCIDAPAGGPAGRGVVRPCSCRLRPVSGAGCAVLW